MGQFFLVHVYYAGFAAVAMMHKKQTSCTGAYDKQEFTFQLQFFRSALFPWA